VWVEEAGNKVVYALTKIGKQQQRTNIGVLADNNQIKVGRRLVGEYRKPGLYRELVAHCYRQVADVWKLDNEFAAKWASWAFPREHRDLKVVLCAFMLVQSRKGDPVLENGEILFRDEDYRNVGEAMCLQRAKGSDLNPKLLLRVGDILSLPEVAVINRELGFGSSARNPPLGRYYKVVEKWLRYREQNLPLLQGLVKAGFRTTVQQLARKVGYKPDSAKFFEVLRWKQAQAKDGRRVLAIGQTFETETWEGKSEEEVCLAIVKDKPSWKRIVGLLPATVGVTRAVLTAALESGCLSNSDLIILTPTLEELGLLTGSSAPEQWTTAWLAATKAAENQRATNIAKNVKTEWAKKGLEAAADKAAEKALTEVTKDLRVYCIVDKSGSMETCLERAQGYLTKFLGGFPLDRLHVSVFNTIGTEVHIRAPSAAAVRQAFMGHTAGGGTSYAAGVAALAAHTPKPEEDTLMLFVGDEEDSNEASLVRGIEASGIRPSAFGLLKVNGCDGWGRIVTEAAKALGIPCFPIDENMFNSNDPYAVTRMLRNLIASTPVSAPKVGGRREGRKSLVEEILSVELLQKPVWA
jgi:hypothetical protein